MDIARLRKECEYDPEGDTGVDSLIDYKDALEGAYDSLWSQVVVARGVLLGLYEGWDEYDSGTRVEEVQRALSILGATV